MITEARIHSLPPQVCVKLTDKPDYVRLPEGEKSLYQDYPELSLEDWHKKTGVFVE